ncbi:hypothetical protein [Arthrobacter sp. VKM Ac-2550]|uniref:hypothetical protein n=1 Tax=Crystallibacter permensis TaxID=1938888 RepID=UPI0022278D75|nr:hypothetical protein [Arthrobacter sp. VKM Ac-2550]MCW2131712.1 hypothetical protein [Arthrobacter sp. VKM Ac-2550]
MNNQGNLFKTSALTALATLLLAVVLYFVGSDAGGSAGTFVITAFILLLIAAAAALTVALFVYREDGRKPGSTPLIYAVIALPVSIVLFFLFIPTSVALLMLLGMFGFVTGLLALVAGLVKKLSIKTA